MSDELAKARAIAADATPGPWHSDHDGVHGEWSVLRYGGSPSDYATDICDPDSMTGADADYIATFDPPTVLAMLDVIEAADHMPHDVCWTPDEVNLNEWARCGRCVPCRLSQTLARVRDLFGGAA